MKTKAIILCAGRGGRLLPLTKNTPKCLLDFGGRTILEWCLGNLGASGIREAVVVTGFKSELIEELVRARGLDGVSFVHNRDFESTNTAYSLHLALGAMDADFVLVNGDVLYDRAILEDLLGNPAENCVTVDSGGALDREGVKVLAEDGRIKKINKEIDPRLSQGEAIGLNKIHRSLIPELARIFDGLEARGEFHHFFEKGIERICEEGDGQGWHFGLSLIHGRPWVEIDTLKDLEYARREVFPKICR